MVLGLFLCREITIYLETRTHLLIDEYLMCTFPAHLPQASPSAANALLELIGVEKERTANSMPIASTIQQLEKLRHAS
jgi:hypothetical protein